MRLTALVMVMMVSMLVTAAPGSLADPAAPQANMEILMNPAQLNDKAPDKFQVKFDTSKGEFIVEVTRAWAPNGADRFYNLVKNGFYDNCRFFRVVQDFMVQFGINGNPKLNTVWYPAKIKDDPVKQSNVRGYITYAMAGKDTRTTQLFINFKDNSFLDSQGFSPFGKVTKGMNIVDSIYNKYGEKPDQGQVQAAGNAYLEKNFPSLDFIKSATIVTPAAK
jgi:peptidyl-prolyl cis-trans isomerase A (cyclophilin A)